MVKLQEAENQIVVDYEVYARRPNDADLILLAKPPAHRVGFCDVEAIDRPPHVPSFLHREVASGLGLLITTQIHGKNA
jgi:hypothetical protein